MEPNEYLYIDDGGMICCADHGGSYLRAKVGHTRPTPNSVIFTNRGSWVVISGEVARLEGIVCERCGR